MREQKRKEEGKSETERESESGRWHLDLPVWAVQNVRGEGTGRARMGE